MKQTIVYNDRPASINNKNDNAKMAYQNNLKNCALEQNAHIMSGDLYVTILWLQNNPADIDNIIKYTLDALKGVCYNDDKNIVHLTISKKHSQKDQVIITIENKFSLSKFIKKLIYASIARPILKYIKANFKDMIDDEKPKNIAKNSNLTQTQNTLQSPKDNSNLNLKPKNIDKNMVLKRVQQDIKSALINDINMINMVKFNLKSDRLILYPIATPTISAKEQKKALSEAKTKLLNALQNQNYLKDIKITIGFEASKNASKININDN